MITFVSPKDIYDLRLRLLRPGKPIEAVMFPNDMEIGSFHIGKYMDSKLVGIVSYSKNIFPFDKDLQNVYQLRGMAIESEFQKQGIGNQLCDFGEKILLHLNTEYVWCNARTSALYFYKKQGYQTLGNEFQIEDAGPHFVMRKAIQ